MSNEMLLSTMNYRFQREIICNVLCEQCLQISLYISPLFYQMVSHDMLLSMINSDFCQKSFVMLYVNNVYKYLYIFLPLIFSNWCYTTCCWVRWTQLSARNHLWCCMWTMFANISLCLPLILSNVVTQHVVEYDDLRFQPEILCNSVWSKLANIYLYCTPYFLNWWKTTCCWAR